MTYMHNPLPSPEYTGDSDSESEIAKELAQRRRQLDEEVAKFQAQKDKEFTQFEIELKSRKRQAKLAKAHRKYNYNTTGYYEVIRRSPSSTPPKIHALETNEQRSIPSPISSTSRNSEPIQLIGSNSGPKSTAPTVCLDRLNIVGRTQLQPLPDTNIRKAESNVLCSDKPANLGLTIPDRNPVKPLEVVSKEGRPNIGVTTKGFAFTEKQFPSFLPLLALRNEMSDEAIIDGTQTEPASPTDASMINDLGLRSSSMPTESSINDTFKIPPTKRAYTSPSGAHRRALAPIICNVNGRKRSPGKRKRVTFQLADRAIVQPSSSYEENESTTNAFGNRLQERDPSKVSGSDNEEPQRPVIQRKQTPMDLFGRRKRIQSPVDTPEEDVGKSMADLLLGDDDLEYEPENEKSKSSASSNVGGYFSIQKSSTESSTSSKRRYDTGIDTVPVEHSSWDNYEARGTHNAKEAVKSGGPVGTQKVSLLQSNHYSPQSKSRSIPSIQTRAKYYPGMLDDFGLPNENNVGFFELDEEMSAGPKAETGVKEDDVGDDGFDVQLERTGVETGTDMSIMGTSVPIDILKPSSINISSTWIGTFGH